MKTGEYAMSLQELKQPDWILRCNYLKSLVSDRKLHGLDEKQLS